VRSDGGQATIEWIGVVLVVSLALGAATSVAPRVDGRSFGGFITHSIVCAARGGCDDGDAGLVRAYGARDAELVREYAPNVVYEPGEPSLPVDYRECRAHRCADAPDDRDLDVHRSTETGHRATVFTHLARDRGETFIQYWLYYPDSNSTVLGSDHLWRASPAARVATWAVTGERGYPGYHRDDWESYQVRVDRHGRANVRASSHGHYQGCKQRRCRNRWTAWTGWTRVSRGSHAGHIPLRSELTELRLRSRWPPLRARYRYHPTYPGRDIRERTSTAPGLRLVPLQDLIGERYDALDPSIEPPWEKGVFHRPRSNSS
jgi:hypothetical protein